MIDFDKVRAAVTDGLRDTLGISVIRSNTTAPLPKLPFCSYTVRTLLDNSKGTWARYEDGCDRIPAHQTYSITINSEKYSECATLALTAFDFFTNTGVVQLKDNGIVVESVGAITPRDTVLTVDYEYRQGFDVKFGLMNTLEYSKDDGIQTITLEGREIRKEGS